MTNKNISALTAATTPLAGTELLAIWDASGTTKQVSITNVTAGRGVSASTFTTSGRVSLGNTANSTASGPTLKLDGSGAGSDQIALYEASSDKWHINSSSGVLGLYNITTSSYAVTISAANIFAIAGAATVGTTLGITGTTTAAAINASGAITATPSISIGSTANEWTGAPSAVNPLIQSNGTTSYGTISAASSRADGTSLRIGSFTGEYQTNSATHKTIGVMDFVTTGTTANQRGGGWNLTLKADGSTSKTVVISATVAGGVSVTGTLGVSTGAAVGGATPGTGGIAFPATAVAVADPNTLDDYEEGTWTPSPTSLTVVGTPTYTGTYTKIGRMVFVRLRVQSTVTTASTLNTTSFAGLPFTSAVIGVVHGIQSSGTFTAIGTGLITGTTIYTPTWSAAADITIMGWYYV